MSSVIYLGKPGMIAVANPRKMDTTAIQVGLGDSDFRVLHVLQGNGPTPVNAIGPKVNLNLGSVSVAVDRLAMHGLNKCVHFGLAIFLRHRRWETPIRESQIASVFRSRVIDVRPGSMMIEGTGGQAKIDRLVETSRRLRNYRDGENGPHCAESR